MAGQRKKIDGWWLVVGGQKTMDVWVDKKNKWMVEWIEQNGWF